MKTVDPFRAEILSLNYWEHFKASQDAHRALGANNPRAIELQHSANEILTELNKLKKPIINGS